MKTIKLTGLIVLFFGLAANSQMLVNSEWQVVDNEDYYISYPKNWTMDFSGQMGSSFIIFSPLTSAKDKFRENINLLVQSLNGQAVNLDKFVDITTSQIKTNVKNGNIIESRRVKTNPEYHKMIYIGDKADVKYKFEQYYWIKKGAAYILTFSCELKEFDKYKTTGEAIMKSFELK